MDTSVNLLPDSYLRQLLALSDEVKLFIINKLSASLLAHREEQAASAPRESFASGWIESLSVKGGEPMPADVDDIQSLLEDKYV